MTSVNLFWRRAKLPLAVSLASTLAGPAFGVSFNIGEIEGQFDSSLSVGASWSTAKPNQDLIGVNNGGKGLSQTSDDGHLNFKRGETFSKIFKGIHDLELKYGDTGVFVRGKYWYDFELKDESRPFKDISDHNRKEGAKSSGGQILDAFVYHNYSIADLPGTVRAGKQVVSWGESTFIGNSINSINPIDVSAFRRPGSEIKEGLIPVNMLFATQSLTDRLTVEGFYQLEWDQTVVDNCGTFFGNDVVADGCDNNYTVASPAIRPLQPIAAAFGQGFEVTSEGVVVPRGGDRDARDSGQWGTALRWLGDDTEYGLYFMNYHSRTPTVGTVTAGLSTLSALPGIVGTANAIAPGTGSALAQSVSENRQMAQTLKPVLDACTQTLKALDRQLRRALDEVPGGASAARLRRRRTTKNAIPLPAGSERCACRCARSGTAPRCRPPRVPARHRRRGRTTKARTSPEPP